MFFNNHTVIAEEKADKVQLELEHFVKLQTTFPP